MSVNNASRLIGGDGGIVPVGGGGVLTGLSFDDPPQLTANNINTNISNLDKKHLISIFENGKDIEGSVSTQHFFC